MSRPPSPPAAAVFDCDGLLIDTEPLWTIAENALFARYGRVFSPDGKRALLGTTGDAAGRVLARLLDQPERGRELLAELVELVDVELGAARPMPGVLELLAGLDGRLPIAAASNSPRRLLRRSLEGSGLHDRFPTILTSDDVANPKPAPDLYVAACARLGASPSQAIALEDSPTGVAAARAAGLWVIGVPSYPGVVLDADLVVPSLSAPEVLAALTG
ncbi:MAG: HAD family phosphatase [Candidatus Dormiibacterota bacterium]